MLKQLVRKCPVCGSSTAYAIGALDFALFDDCPLSRSFDVVVCDKCCFVFYDTPNSAQQYADFYREHYFSSSYISNADILSVDAVVNSRYSPVELLKGYLKKTSMICEIGCGRGALLSQFQESGYGNLYGIDPSAECINLVKNKYKIEAGVGTADNIYFDFKFDVVISTHALEHILNLSESVKNIANIVKHNGVCYVEVPDLDEYDSQNVSIPIDYLTFFDHINHFNINSLQRLFGQHGFVAVKHGKKILNEETRMPLPAVYGIFRKTGNAKKQYIDMHDRYLCDIDKFRSWLDLKWFDNDQLECLALSKIPIYIWGINLPMQKMLAMSPLKRCNIVGMLDNDLAKQRKSINGIKIQSPDVLADTLTEETAVVIWRGPYCESIQKELKQKNYKGKTVVL